MYKKYEISGRILVKTGLHIGGSTQYSPIGSVDASVVRDSLTNLPIIPGSSLKGKMRTLLARANSDNNIVLEPEQDKLEIINLFGKAPKGKNEQVILGRLHFFDMKVANRDELKRDKYLDSLTEVKFENTISRSTGGAKPRQIERVVPGVEFELKIIYDAWFSCVSQDELKSKDATHELLNEKENEELEACNKKIKSDFELIAQGMKLLELDYLGGHGSRGYGKIEFRNLTVECVFGEKNQIFENELTQLLPKPLLEKEGKDGAE